MLSVKAFLLPGVAGRGCCVGSARCWAGSGWGQLLRWEVSALVRRTVRAEGLPSKGLPQAEELRPLWLLLGGRGVVLLWFGRLVFVVPL